MQNKISQVISSRKGQKLNFSKKEQKDVQKTLFRYILEPITYMEI